MIAGTLEVQMLANLARLAEDMGKAKNIVGEAVHGIEKILGALGIGFGAHELLEKITSVAEGMDKLKSASEKTGASVENLSRLQFFAGVSGSNIDAVSSALAKLSKAMAATGNDTAPATQALKFLGLTAKDAAGNLKDPSALFEEISQKLIGYQDGAGKAAIATALFGKAGVDMLPMLKKMAELGDVEASVTEAQAAAAEEYLIEVARLNRQKEILWQTVVSALLPSMESFVKVLFEASKQADSLGSTAKGLAADGSIEKWADAGAMGAARMIDVLKIIPLILSAIGASFKAAQADLELLPKHLAIIASFATPGGLTKAEGDAAYKELLVEQAALAADAKQKLLDIWNAPGNATEKAMAQQIELRKAAAQFKATEGGEARPAKPLNFSLGDAKLAAAELKLYQSALKQLENQLGALNHQTEVEKLAFELYGKAATDAFGNPIRAADGNVIHLAGSLEKLSGPHGKQLLLIAAEVDRRKQVAEVLKSEIAYMEALDKAYEAQAAIRLAAYQADKMADAEMQFKLDMIGKTAVEIEKATAARRVDMELFTRLRAAAAAAPEGGEGFQATTDALYKRAEEEKRIVLAGIDARLAAERSWLTGATSVFNDYADHAANAAEGAKTAFTNAFKNMEDALVVFMQTGKLNFKNLADSIIADIIRIQVRQNITGPLASNMGGIMSLLGNVLGPSTQAAAPVVEMAFMAAGGPVSAGSPYVVGEKGPEVFVPGSSGSIVPNEAASPRMSVTNVFHITGQTDTRSQSQIAAAAGQGVNRALARNT